MQNGSSPKVITRILFAAFLALTSVRRATAADDASEEHYQVVSAAPYDQLSKAFIRSSGWTGADAAYSIPLKKDLSLWLFGDTFIGDVLRGTRVKTSMINNSAAWQTTNRNSDSVSTFEFFWNSTGGKAESIIPSNTKNTWIWPGSSAVVDEKLYSFLHLVHRVPHRTSSWGFAIKGHQLMQVDNPLSKPTEWIVHRVDLPEGFEFGNATVFDGRHLYVYGEYPPAAQGLNGHPIALARIERDRLKNLDNTGWEFWCYDRTRGDIHRNNDTRTSATDASDCRWVSKLDDPVVLIPDGAPEMSVGQVRGFAGYFATYSRPGLSRDIVIRHADRPEGPWSDPQLVYTCPPTAKTVFVYNAKAHPELATVDGELIITYCENTDSMKSNMQEPTIYAPRAVRIRLQKQ